MYVAPYEEANFTEFLNKLEEVVDKWLEVGVTPIISWIHHEAEARANEDDQLNYLTWWGKVAMKLKDKSYRLAFNLFTELGVDACGDLCGDSLRENIDKYNTWTSEVVQKIRQTGGKNAQRILILASPKKTANGLDDIDSNIYTNDSYMMVEWHDYAAGPNNRSESRRYWTGTGTEAQRENLREQIQTAKGFALPSYFGAWMPRDNAYGSLIQEEVISFAQFFTAELKDAGIPWSLNVLDDYYNTKKWTWLDENTLKGVALNTSLILDSILNVLSN